MEARGEQPGAVALWGAPIVSGAAAPGRPNVLFYVIDGGGADQMSLYGYERETTPFLGELAQQGVVFERAHSNATWTQPSTASFMTGLHHSVLGGLRRGLHSTPVPDAAVTMAEHFRRGGWFTTSLTTNPNCARVIGLQRGVDVLDDTFDDEHSGSAAALHARFLELRAQYPGAPWWAHIQTTDVHEPNIPTEEFAGRWVPPADVERLWEWEERMDEAAPGLFGTTSIAHYHDEALRRAGIDRHAYYDTRRGLYDETMRQQDAALRDFVQQLKDAGEWENTLLVIGSDHGHPAGTFARWGRGLIEPQPEEWQGALFDSYASRVPLIVVWPGHLPGGRRIAEPVAMIDVLPTLLELAGLPAPEICQGRSLAAALRGGAPPRGPVLFDEVRVDEASGALVGNLELIDGRWGASLEVGPVPDGADPARGRHAVPAGGRWGAVHPWFADVPRLLLYDLQADRFATRAVNDAHLELVRKYEGILRERWEAHVALAQGFTAAGGADMDPEMLERLKALGYVR
ncbi:MAG: sulfatase [Planctomycetes bacterium]|nr:sulfatase [Planctomycetota bacterium]